MTAICYFHTFFRQFKDLLRRSRKNQHVDVSSDDRIADQALKMNDIDDVFKGRFELQCGKVEASVGTSKS